MTTDYRDDQIRHSRTFLERWNGARARLLRVTDSHQHVDLLFTVEGREGNLVISCSGPSSICCDCSFAANGLVIQKADTDHEVVLRDQSGLLRIVAERIWCFENVKKP